MLALIPAAGMVAGLIVAFLGWETALRLSPLILLPVLLTRFCAIGALATIVGVLTVISVAQINSTLAVINAAGELQYGEAIIYDQAARILRGEPLYQPLDREPFSVAAYTPLYYFLAAGLRAAFGPGFLPGRIVTFGAGLAAAGLVGYIVAHRTGYRWAGILAGLLFLSLGLPWPPPRAEVYLGGDVAPPFWLLAVAQDAPAYSNLPLYKEDLPAVALSLGAIAILAAGTRPRYILFAALLAALALLTKQTAVAPGLAGAVWLWRRDRRKAALFTGLVLGASLGPSAVFELTTGAFVANTVFANANPLRLEALAWGLVLFLYFQGGPALVAGLYALGRLRQAPREQNDLLVYFWLASLVPLVGLAKVGSYHHHWMGFAASTAILATLGLWPYLAQTSLPRWRPLLPVLPLIATLMLVSPAVSSARMRPSPPSPIDPALAHERQELIDRVRSEKREVLASPLDLVVLADRQILLEPYVFSIMSIEGQWDPAPVIRRICTGEIGLVLFFNPLENGSGQYQGYPLWPPAVLKALQEIMVFDSRQALYYVYVPRTTSQSGARPGQGGACP